MSARERIGNFIRRHITTLALLGLVAYLWFRPPAWVSDLDEPVANAGFTTLDGRAGSLDALRGRVVLVNFWATWCPYCRHEMPAMEAFYRDHRARGFEILALSVDDDPDTVAAFMREKGYSFPVVMAGPELRQAFGKVTRLPTSFIIDRDGRIRHKVSGQVHYPRLEKLVTPLLAPTP